MRSSLAAGVKTIVTVNSFTEGQDFQGAALVVDNLGEPQQPMRVLAGNAVGSTLVDVPLLEKLFAAS